MAITDNMVGYWNLSESSGSRADSFGSNPLTDNASVTGTTGPGAHNAAHFVRASNQWLSHTDNATLSVGDIDFTIAIWIKYTTNNDLQGSICYSGNGASRSWEIVQGFSPTTDFFFQVSSDGSAQNGVQAATFGAVATGSWHFVVAWHDSVNNQLGITVDNGAADTASWTTGVFDSTGDLQLGRREGSSPGNGLDGDLAMFGMWKRILTGTERTFLYNSGNGRNYSELLGGAQSSLKTGYRVF